MFCSSSARTSDVNVEVEFLFDFKVTVSTDLFLHSSIFRVAGGTSAIPRTRNPTMKQPGVLTTNDSFKVQTAETPSDPA